MYRNCIFCSAELGTNESIETFPVGRQVAFDGWKGRLWAVCPLCARWNLAPIEERWESVEAAEKLFRDARLRVQSENVGMAKLPDGTRLVRIGAAVPGEMAAWRYGTQLLHRRKRYLVGAGLTTAGAVAAYGGLSAMGFGIIAASGGMSWVQQRRNRKVVHRLEEEPGRTLIIRRWHVDGMNLAVGPAGDVQVHVREAHRNEPAWRGHVNPGTNDIVVLGGADAQALLKRAMVVVNRKGASRDALKQADGILSQAGSVERLLAEAAAGRASLGDHAGRHFDALKGPGALAFEMALNEESERRALEGELAALEAAWREAEEIAAIADALPGEAVFNRLLDRLTR
jgi:hypothetical protein